MANNPQLPEKPTATSTIGTVVESDRQTIVVTVEQGQSLHYRDFIAVPFETDDQIHCVLIAQVDLLVGEGIKIGTSETRGAVSIFGINADIVKTMDVQETRVRATARVISFIDLDSNKAAAFDPTLAYMQKPVYLANHDYLKSVFSKLDDNSLAALEVGYLLGTPDVVPVVLDPTGFMRHSAVFGQSGSGKSFSFGIILEEILLKTDARVLILDPNADYREFQYLRTRSEVMKYSRREYSLDQHEDMQKRWGEMAQKFLMFGSPKDQSEGRKLALSFSDLGRIQQADLLGLDPTLDREEYNAFREAVETLQRTYTLRELLDAFAKYPSMDRVRLTYRIKNKEIDQLSIWGNDSSVAKLVEEEWRCACVDLRDVSPLERSLVAASILQALYYQIVRDRKVTFIVVDEAHNLCPAVPWASHQKASREILEEIAAEGRKYGAFLMLMTQSPTKLSEQALSQCDNIILMKMTSSAEVKALEVAVKDAGQRLAQAAFNLRKGQAICMGGIVKSEATIGFDLRRTQPVGEDVSKGWARRR